MKIKNSLFEYQGKGLGLIIVPREGLSLIDTVII